MPGRQTDCLERPLSNGFRQLGVLVARYPWWFLMISIMVSAGLATGFYLYPQRRSTSTDEEILDGRTKREQDFMKQNFPVNDSGDFSAQRLHTEGTFASLIAVTTSGNILTTSAFQELINLDEMVRSLHVSCNHSGTTKNLTFEQLCARSGDKCAPVNHLLQAVNGNASAIETLNFTYPMYGGQDFLGSELGGIQVQPVPPHTVRRAEAIRLVYYLQDDSARGKKISGKWLEKYITAIAAAMKGMHFKSIKVSYFTSISHQQENEKHSEKMPPLIYITYILTTLFSVLSCVRFDCVRNKAGVAMFGMISSGLAIVASFGLLMYCGVPYVISVANAPFLSLGVGVDNMFMMISCWQQTQVNRNVEERLADTYAAVAVSITITTMTDVLAFYLGIMTQFASVQSFCIYTGTSVLFCFLYSITFFGAILALNGKREEDNRHWLVCTKVKDVAELDDTSGPSLCCFGGSFDKSTGAEEEHPVTIFFQYYGPILTQFWTKILVVVLYCGYLAVSIFGCFQLQEGTTSLRNQTSNDSYIIHYYYNEDIYFSTYGPKVMVVLTEAIAYWDPSVRKDIEKCMESLESSSSVDSSLSDSWLRDYSRDSMNISLNLDDKAEFISNITSLFQLVPNYKQDVAINHTRIEASRFFIQIVNATSIGITKRTLHQLREIANRCAIPIMIYHPSLFHLDQYHLIIQSTIQNVAVAAGVMLLISLLLIPNPLCSLWVTFAIASIIIGVTGFMAYWNVNLDSVSMINLVICIGFSVDFSAHISYAFVTDKNPDATERVNKALHLLGYPIVQGAFSTILGVLALSAAQSYIFKTFFKIMFLVIIFGAVHGLVFVPVFLTFFGICDRPFSTTEKIKKLEKESQHASCTKDPVNLEYYDNQVETVEARPLPGTVITLPSIINIGNVYNGYLFHNRQDIKTSSADDKQFSVGPNYEEIDCLKEIQLLHFANRKGSNCT